MSEPRLVALLETNDLVELAIAKSLLDGASIRYVVQGEHHASLLAGPMGNAAVVPRVLVSEHDLERAHELLEANPDYRGAGQTLGEGVCPVHEKDSIGTCDRCGSFLCNECEVTGAPPLCESCSRVETRVLDQQRDSGNRRKRWKVLALIALFVAVPPLVAFIAALLRRS